ncbi:hypothetical protein CBL_20182, partial [Carabus blaptoides fortunei]
MSRGFKILQLHTNKSASSFLKLPSYETTDGLGRVEQNLACENWYKFNSNTSASQVLLPEHEEHRKIANTKNVSEIPLSTAESSSIERNVKRNIKNKINLQETYLVNDYDTSDDDHTYQPTDEISSCSSDSSSSSKKREIVQNNTEIIVKSDFNNFKCVPTSNPL